MDGSDQRKMLAVGCGLVALGIVTGAFGAHALRASLGEQALGWWQTGVQYHLWNALGLVALSAAPLQRAKIPAALIISGLFVFSGSLYLMALTGMRWLGAVTPVGGVLMILGWGWAAWGAWAGRSAN